MDNVQKFISFVKQKAKAEKVRFYMAPKRYLETDIGIQCNGYFDGDQKILAVAAGQPQERWIKTLAHEFSHMTQWMDQTDTWIAGTHPTDAEAIVELWYYKKIELNAKQRAYWIGLSRNVELEAERRTLEIIKQHKLPIDLSGYAKHANAYLYFWTYTGFTRRWYTVGKEPYNIPAIVDAMPDTLDQDYAKLPRKYKRLYEEHC